MATLPTAAPLLLALLANPPALTQPASEAPEVVAARHLELTAEGAGQEHEVGISPWLISTLVFNAPLLPGGVVVEGREHFRVVTVDEAAGFVALLPLGTLSTGKRLRLTVRFADGAVPASATFWLVVHPTRAEPQVNVYRHSRSGESYHLEARQARERAERCEARLAQVERQHPGGLVRVLVDGLVEGEKGIPARDITDTLKQRPGEVPWMTAAYGYRAVGRVAVALELKNTSGEPWLVDGQGARLVGKGGTRLEVLRVWPLEPIPPGRIGHVFVEAVATGKEARGTYVLQLAEANGPRTVTLPGVTFP